ncbi:MAG TPA: Rrf2 family transcriptional regulator [Phycisphaerales bacterium]|nr:Rrf2 family transcriptional regulator [Phycisphaerales bacterium]
MISQTIEYALRAMTHLAALKSDASVTSETIAERTKVPKGYLSKILRDLTVAGLINSQRGPNGGFSLSRPSSQISMLDVINAVGPIERVTKCPLGNPAHVKLCPLHRRLDDALASMEREFARTSLHEILESNRAATGECQTLVAVSVKKT